MKIILHNALQLFAEGSAASEGAGQGFDTGVTHAAAGHEALPETAENRAQTGQDAAAEATPGRMTWDQIKADPEYSRHMQEMVRERVKKLTQAQEDLQILTPALRHMAKRLGLDPDSKDYSALAKAITASQGDRDGALRQHYGSLVEQSRALCQKYPGFDLHRELKDPVFAKLTAPGMGVSVEDAYYTVHRREIEDAALQVAAQKTAEQISNAIRAGGGRPEENGTSAMGPSVSAFDYRTASREQREALKARIRSAGARGEKIYPG